MIPAIIAALVPVFTKVIETKIPATGQTIKSFAQSKSNLGGMAFISYGMTLLASDPSDITGHLYFIGGVLAIVIKDAIVKIYGK